jgi:hypothetical protein
LYSMEVIVFAIQVIISMERHVLHVQIHSMLVHHAFPVLYA